MVRRGDRTSDPRKILVASRQNRSLRAFGLEQRR